MHAVLAPLGTQVELTCMQSCHGIQDSVECWDIPGGEEVDAEGFGGISALSSRAENSSAENREPTEKTTKPLCSECQ